MARMKVPVLRILRENEVLIVPQIDESITEFYVLNYEGDDEAEIEVPESAQIEMLRNELENLKRRVSELEKAVMPRATA